MSDIPKARGVEIGEGDRERLRKAIERNGEAAILKNLGVASLTMARCLAGLPVQRATAEFVRRRLQEMTDSEAEQAG